MRRKAMNDRLDASPQLQAIDAKHARLSGDLTLYSVAVLVEPGERLIDQAQGDTWHLDLASVSSVSSAAVALLLDWLRYATQVGVRLQLQHIPDDMRPIIAISDLETLFAELELVE